MSIFVFKFQHANLSVLFVQKVDAFTIGNLAKVIQSFVDDICTNIIGARHGDDLFATLITRDERLRGENMGHYLRASTDNRNLYCD